MTLTTSAATGTRPFRAGLDDEDWFTDAAHDGRATLTSQAWWRLAPGIDPERLTAALRSVADRHEVLGAVVETGDGEVRWRPGVAAPEIGLGPETPPFADIDPASGPLMRAVVTGRLLGLQVSNAVVDEWSWELLLDEIDERYRALDPADTEEPAPQLRDWVRWQRDQVRADGARLVAGWAGQLAAAGPSPSPAAGPGRAGTVEWRGPLTAWDALTRTAADLRATPTMLVVALLGRGLSSAGDGPRGIRTALLNRDGPHALDIVGNLGCQILVPTPPAAAPVPDAVAAVRAALVTAAELAPVSLHHAVRTLWDDPTRERMHCWAPFVAVHPPELDTEPDADSVFAGATVVYEDSPPDEPDGCEVVVDARDGELTVTASWRGADDRDTAVLRDGFAELVAAVERAGSGP